MEDFVNFNLAKKLRGKGFKEKCFAYYMPRDTNLIYNHNQYRGGIYIDSSYSFNSLDSEVVASDFIDAPTISQVLKWLREEKKIHIAFGVNPLSAWRFIVMFIGERAGEEPSVKVVGFKSYEQSALAGIEYVLDNMI